MGDDLYSGDVENRAGDDYGHAYIQAPMSLLEPGEKAVQIKDEERGVDRHVEN